MASNLSRRVHRIENSISLLGMLYDRLRFLQPPMTGLVAAVADMEQFSGTEYLQLCRSRMAQETPFPTAWRTALEESGPQLGQEHLEALLPLGEVLGCTDLDSQLTSIRHTVNLLENQLAGAREYREKHSKLYRSLGVLGGMAVAIVLL